MERATEGNKISSQTPDSQRRVRIAYAGVAACALALFLLLGHGVGPKPDPAWLLTIEASWVNHSTLVAWWFTWFGFAYVLVPVCLVLVAIAAVNRAWRTRSAFAIVSLLLAWQGAEAFQKVFVRPRRLDWVVKHETAFSFPSSHAAIAFGFYLVLAMFVYRSALPYRRIAAAAIAVLVLAIVWSRLALGAHYLTDLAGGALWGTTVVGALASGWPRNVFEGPSSPSLE